MMVILGLGSNCGDRMHYLRMALSHIKKIPNTEVQQVSPVYISDALVHVSSPASWHHPYLNAAIRIETNITPFALLDHVKKIEKKMGRLSGEDWSPRVIDIDILAWDNLIQYDDQLHIPHEHLHRRPFALFPLSDVAPDWIYPLEGPLKNKSAIILAEQWPSRFSGKAPLRTLQIPHRIDTPQWVGIVNITPDSFSDGNLYFNEEKAFAHMNDLVNAGAEVIDFGAEATGPQSSPLSPKLEWQRLSPILTRLLSERQQWILPPKISIDTRNVFVAEQALTLGVDWINDVSALSDPQMVDLLSQTTCDIVFMHHLTIPVDPKITLPVNENPAAQVYHWLENKLNFFNRKSIKKDRLIFDPGIGYGKTAHQSLALIKQISIFRELGVRLLIGHSRKSFLTQFTQRSPHERDIETLAISNFLAKAEVDYLRVHNVDEHARSFKVSAAMGIYINST